MFSNNKVVVANTEDDTLSFIDLADRRILRTMNLRQGGNILNGTDSIGPYDLLYDGDGYIYCANIYDNSIFKIDINRMEIADILYVGSYPIRIKSYLGNIMTVNSDSNSISIIEKQTFTLAQGISVGEKPIDMEIDRECVKLYVANSNSHSIHVIDLLQRKNRVIKLKHSPIGIILEGEYIYILSIIDDGTDSISNISIMDRRRFKIRESMDFNGIFNSMIKINGCELVFTTGISDGYLYRMDMREGNILNKTYLSGMPNRVEWNGENILIITNLSSNRLIIFDIDTDRIIDSIEVGKGPNGVLILNESGAID
ncbi:MAG: YncE family protein [Tissierellia bacterium]|nr:YncE family protein [Tissierellia bacterium]